MIYLIILTLFWMYYTKLDKKNKLVKNNHDKRMEAKKERKKITHEELLELRKKVKDLERDNDILKKDLVILV